MTETRLYTITPRGSTHRRPQRRSAAPRDRTGPPRSYRSLTVSLPSATRYNATTSPSVIRDSLVWMATRAYRRPGASREHGVASVLSVSSTGRTGPALSVAVFRATAQTADLSITPVRRLYRRLQDDSPGQRLDDGRE